LFYTADEAAESARICGVKAIKKIESSKVTQQAEPVAKLFGSLPVYDTAPPQQQAEPLKPN
jgi:hypothetical protein